LLSVTLSVRLSGHDLDIRCNPHRASHVLIDDPDGKNIRVRTRDNAAGRQTFRFAFAAVRRIKLVGGSENDDFSITLTSWRKGLDPSGFDIDARAGGGDDVVTADGTPRPVRIQGGAGNDTITGGPSNDYLHGDAGNDLVQGHDGKDTLFGDDGDDILRGGYRRVPTASHPHPHQRNVDTQRDVLTGGGGHDTVLVSADDKVTGASGDQVIAI
jgi:Ca2+-binding RTX toxin-like protein